MQDVLYNAEFGEINWFSKEKTRLRNVSDINYINLWQKYYINKLFSNKRGEKII